ncbi:unnamed protein product [Gongylonema pulchrum]|uniref:Uncharacterized protein n=1 Tax=Gongylonema pulchrum TaxID=637853 RepID=A0A183E6W5_9BILA|nr:unnamed protein product [Gongylonema pulchrum]
MAKQHSLSANMRNTERRLIDVHGRKLEFERCESSSTVKERAEGRLAVAECPPATDASPPQPMYCPAEP